MTTGRCSVQSAVLRGVEAVRVDVEVSVAYGLPGFFIVGMVDAAVQESKERVKSALKAAGFSMPGERVVVNLAPSSLHKTGSGFDLAIAVGILGATKQISADMLHKWLFVGELSLDGTVRSVPGLLAYALCAKRLGVSLLTASQAPDIVDIEGLSQYGIANLTDLHTGDMCELGAQATAREKIARDYKEVSGNEAAKRALQIAAAGNHGVLMMGPPGSGKTMLASRLPSILPPLEGDDILKAALIHSVAEKDIGSILAGLRPFRSPHHSATAAGLIGGGSPIRPGEISLAHLGVLFLDELPEFKPSVLQQLRQPMESGYVSITRADGNIVFPARFMLIAAANPCPCGYLGDPVKTCQCTPFQIAHYQNRIGGPLLDRIDIHIDVQRIDPARILSSGEGVSSDQLKDGVLRAREFALWRQQKHGFSKTPQNTVDACQLSSSDRDFFEQMAKLHAMSGRSIMRTLSVARTIADMSERERVEKKDLCEALDMRIRDGIGGEQ